MYQGYSNVGQWVVYRLSKYQGGIPENGTIIGSIQSVGAIIKHPNRAGQQYFDFSVGNVFEYSVGGYIDFELGNVWNTNADGFSGAQYPCDNHIKEGA